MLGAFHLKRVLEEEGRELWDGKVQEVKVTDISDRTVALRILLSARNPSASWDLRCLVRERMLAFLQKHPQWLPISRTEMWPSDSHPGAFRPERLPRPRSNEVS